MKTKTQIDFVLIFSAIGVGALLLGCHARQPTAGGVDAGTNSLVTTSLAMRKTMSEGDRLRWLERNGAVPQNDHDLGGWQWQLAQRTSWWGKPLDPKKFWKGRVLWNDASANSDALRHGRLYPPMPYEDTNLPPYPNDEGIHAASSPDGPNISYAESSKEGAFWDRFDKTHPRPPDQIAHEQEMNEDQLRRQDDSYLRNRVLQYNYPAEAFTRDALFWSYVQRKRTEYQALLDARNTNGLALRFFIRDLLVDRKYAIEPLSPDQIRAANAWKVAYLQRLRREKADEQYIVAYLQAWGLSSNQVFGAGN